MYNGACRNEPEAIVVIGDEKDAAEIVKFVRKAKYKINMGDIPIAVQVVR